MALITPTSGYGTEASKPTEAKKEPVGPVPSNAQPAPPASKPWLPLTASLFCLFVSLGGNAYLGMQWWSIRLRCQQLLRRGRPGAEEDEAADEPVDQDEEDQDVRAILEEELPREKASRERKRLESSNER